MERPWFFVLLLIPLTAILGAPAALRAQTANGAITGTVLDQTGAAVAGAVVTATNRETGTVSKATATSTGLYELPSLQPGTYDVTITAKGFAVSTALGIEVQAVQTKQVNAKLQVGSSTQTVTVTEAAPMLQTESAQITATIPQTMVENVPFYNLNNSGLLNPAQFASTQPGSQAEFPSGNFGMRVNGLPDDTFRVIVDGQDITSSIDPTHLSETNPSVYAMSESTLQVSNFDAEFGQVAGGLLNFTTKSGTNHFHGMVWENWVNEILNAGNPYTNNGSGGLVRPVDRINNFGFQVGGPVMLGKLYNGKDKTFFFFNWEFAKDLTSLAGDFATAPIAAYRTGDFSSALGGQLGTDPLGRPIYENEIYDPSTTRVYNGQVVRDPFQYNGQLNVIPPGRTDPVAAAIQALIPAVPSAYNSEEINNYPASLLGNQTDTRSIPSVRIDQNIGANLKMNFYYQQWRDDLPNNTASYFPWPIADSRLYHTRVHTYRFNADDTLTPTMLLHFGVGEEGYVHGDHAPNSVLDYNSAALLGIVGATISPAPFPELEGLYAATGGGFATSGATGTLGMTNYGIYTNDTPTAVAFLSWLKGNHSFKFGGEWRDNLWTDLEKSETAGVYSFEPQETGLPYLDSGTLNGGDVGFPYASFFLGMADSAFVRTPQEPTFIKQAYGVYGQDTWKVTPKLTLDYGVRYDYQSSWHEKRHRWSEFGPNVANPSAGNLLGGVQYEDQGTTGEFTNTYPYAVGPRLGAAFELTSKDVLRGGWGFTYGPTNFIEYLSNTSIVAPNGPWNTIYATSPSFGVAATTLQTGLMYSQSELYPTTYNPGVYPFSGQINSPSYYINPGAGRPSRINQWNITYERQITSKIGATIAYVGNRGVWLGSNLLDPNANTAARFAAKGLDVTNPTDLALLESPVSSPQAQAAGLTAPYAGWPTGESVAQLLRPYPQFSTINSDWATSGNSWYDALQVKAEIRNYHGLYVTAGYVRQSEYSLGVTYPGYFAALTLVNDVYNRAADKMIDQMSQPNVVNTAISYRSLPYGDSKLLQVVTRDWTYGAFLRYASGTPIPAPYAQNNLNSVMLRNDTNVTFFNRVPGVPLFLKNLNCHCINPYEQLTLNPAAWSDPAAGTFGTGQITYNDYRYQRRPQESMGLGRLFAIREGMSLELRMQFFNVFNRAELANPTGTNALQSTVSGASGLESGFGFINAKSLFGPPRQGQLTANFTF